MKHSLFIYVCVRGVTLLLLSLNCYKKITYMIMHYNTMLCSYHDIPLLLEETNIDEFEFKCSYKSNSLERKKYIAQVIPIVLNLFKLQKFNISMYIPMDIDLPINLSLLIKVQLSSLVCSVSSKFRLLNIKLVSEFFGLYFNVLPH